MNIICSSNSNLLINFHGIISIPKRVLSAKVFGLRGRQFHNVTKIMIKNNEIISIMNT